MAMAARLSGSKKKVGMMSPDERSALTPHAGPRSLTTGLEAFWTKDSSTLFQQRPLIGCWRPLSLDVEI